jgi:hypothetical protein
VYRSSITTCILVLQLLYIIILLLILLQDNKIVKQYDQTWFYYPPSETIFSYASGIGIAVNINTILLLMSSNLYSALQKATLNFNVRSVRDIFKYGRANDQWNCGMRERSNTLWFIYSWKFIEWNPVALGLVKWFWSVAASNFNCNTYKPVVRKPNGKNSLGKAFKENTLKKCDVSGLF